MSRSRGELQKRLEQIEGLAYDSTLDGPAVYYQPPPTMLMSYPCIRYTYDGADIIHADDMGYVARNRYSFIVIDPDPDSIVRDQLATFPGIRVERSFVADNLYHYAFTIYY